MEIWDWYNARFEKQAGCLVRGNTLLEGQYHLVVEVLVAHDDGTFLLMQRDLLKNAWPGKFEASAGGSALKGETPLLAARRELFEETGIEAYALTCFPHTVDRDCIFVNCIAKTTCIKDSIQLQRGETIGYQWVTQPQLMDFFHSTECIAPQVERLVTALGINHPILKTYKI